MERGHEAHTWGRRYEHAGASYRECTEPGCLGYQEWICVLDRWSDPFEQPSPRRRAEQSGRGVSTNQATDPA